jgi:bifunctional non-homologous end joining protein LigD
VGLTVYKTKRNFKKTPEPTGGRAADTDKLRFVVQKHDATRLHYDFRLEMQGVLKSWAVPKGPSTDPSVKRLAMMVEDHPYDYRNFEGIIPSGYGAGTVIVWDEGFYEPGEGLFKDKRYQEKELLRQLHAGKLKITLKGKKLKGVYELIKINGRGENAWLMFKIKDEYASGEDITLKDKSVISKKTLAQVEKTSHNFYESNHKKKSLEKPAEKRRLKPSEKKTPEKKALAETDNKESEVILSKAPRHKFPEDIKPMLATLVDKPFDEPGWVYEVKWDGYRALALSNKGTVEIKSRNDKSFNDKFYPVTKAVGELNLNAVIDGEIVVVNDKGLSDFGALQNWRSEADGELLFYVFDLAWYNGKDLTGLPLIERRAVLKTIIPHEGIIKLSENFGESGIEFFEAAKKIGLEGIIAKKALSEYYPGLRTKEWLKIKANKRQEVVIGGYTKNDGTSKPFSALIAGVFDKGKFIYCGKIGTGFNISTQKEMLKQFKPLITKKIPFSFIPDINKPSRFRPNPPHAVATWLKPKLVCEVSYNEITSDGIMRHPSFEGMRIDKNAKDVVLETETPVKTAVKKTNSITAKKIIVPPGKKERKTLLNPTEETQVRKINGHELKFTNLSKIYWPEEKITKRDLINYYYQAAPYILPYLKGRPQSMNRHPNGIYGESFYYKDVTGKAPGWIETFLYHSSADNRDRHYLVAKDEASLLYMASLGCIEMNPWSSRVESENYPDWCMIDLDPGKTSFEQVIKTARVTKDILDSLGVPGYPKTSGSTGMHIYIPFGAKYTYDQSKEFARVIAAMIQNELPEFTTIERVVKNRKGKMYIDFLQNRPQATISAPYSVRPKPGATVSMPLHWDEVKKGLKMRDFTIFNAIDRIKSEGDLFKPVLGKGIDLPEIIKQLEKK